MYQPNICEKCGHDIQPPDYPFCKGRPEDHDKQYGGWAWGGSAAGSNRPLVLGENLTHDGKVRS